MTDLRDKIARALAEWQDGPDAEPWVYDMYTEAADAVLAVIDLDKVRAEAVHEAALYVERITPKGLVDRADVIADLTIAADRLESGIHANGRERKAEQ